MRSNSSEKYSEVRRNKKQQQKNSERGRMGLYKCGRKQVLKISDKRKKAKMHAKLKAFTSNDAKKKKKNS